MPKESNPPPIPIYAKPEAEPEIIIFSSVLGVTASIVFLIFAVLLFAAGNSPNVTSDNYNSP